MKETIFVLIAIYMNPSEPVNGKNSPHLYHISYEIGAEFDTLGECQKEKGKLYKTRKRKKFDFFHTKCWVLEKNK